MTAQKEYSGSEPKLYLAFELGAKTWKLGFTIGLGQKPRQRNIPAGNLQRLGQEIERAKRRFQLSEEAPVLSCYEAGRDGFWLHRHLVQNLGIVNLVVDSSSIEVNRKARRAKSDGLDVTKLCRMLCRYDGGEHKVWSVATVPSEELEDERHLYRELDTLKAERTKLGNRLKSLLAQQGIGYSGSLTKLDGAAVEALRRWDGAALPEGFKGRLLRELERWRDLAEEIQELEAARAQQILAGESERTEKIRQLMRLKAIGPNGASTFVMELFWKAFQNRREVGSCAGLAPTPFQSGQTAHEQGITKAGSSRVRKVAVEIAWLWLRFQPKSRLSRWFQERFGGAGKRARKIGIVALARKLIIELWRFLETGALPEGAVLKV